MRTLTKFAAPAAIVLFAIASQATAAQPPAPFSSGSYRGNFPTADKVDPSKEVPIGAKVDTGGATYKGQTNQPKIFVNPERESWLSERQLDNMYLG